MVMTIRVVLMMQKERCICLTRSISTYLPLPKQDTPDAPIKAKEELANLGPLSTDEKITAGAFAITVSLW